MPIDINYRTSTLKKEIIDTLIDIHIESSPVMIWQNLNGTRTVTKARIEAIDFASDSLFLLPYTNEDRPAFEKLNIGNTFYFRGNSKNIVFKQDRPGKKSKNGNLQIFIPDEVRMFEKRTETRLVFNNSTANLTTSIFPGGRIDHSTKSFLAELHDVSLSGMGLYLEKKHSRLFFEKDKIKIERIGNYRFPRGVHGVIIFTIPEHDKIDRVRIGVRFNERLTPEILNDINPTAR
ncbi:MAG: hypothetical protein WC635_17065 [Bacteriovorax sp.]|jgi:hypothetical protein